MLKQIRKGKKKVPIEQYIDVMCLTGPYSTLGLVWLLNKKLSWKLQLIHEMSESLHSAWFGYYDMSTDAWIFLAEHSWLKAYNIRLPFKASNVLFFVGDFFLHHKEDIWNDIILLQEEIYIFELPMNYRKRIIKKFEQCLTIADMSR